MQKFLDAMLKALAIVCAVLFVLTTGAALLLFNAEKRLFNAQLYISALEKQGFYEQLPALASETLASSSEEETQNTARSFLNLVPAKDWETVLVALLPADVSRPMTEQALQSLFDYLNGKSETASLSMVKLKAHLTGPAGTEALLAILRAQPACTLDQIAQLTIGNLFGQNTEFILCNPSEELLDLFQPLLQTQLQTIAATIPDNVDLTPNATDAENPLAGLRAARAFMRFSPLLPLGLLFLVTIFAVRDLHDWLNWWGIPIFIGGVLGLVLAAAINPLFQWVFATYAKPRIPSFLATNVTDTLRDLIAAVLSGVTAPIVFQSAAFVLVGMIMILSLRLRKPATSPSS